MSSTEIGDHFNLAEIKDEIDLDQDDKENDAELKRKGKNANRDLHSELIEFADNLPLTDDNALMASTAVTYHVASQWWDKKDKGDKAERYMDRFKGKVKSIIKSLKAKPSENTRTKQATASCSYASSLLSSIPGITDKDQNLVNS